jgi:hypothetical protein
MQETRFSDQSYTNKKEFDMKKTITQISLIITLVAVVFILSGQVTARPVEAQTTRIPIVNYFLSCEEVTVERAWVADGVKHVRGRYLVGEVISTEAYHTGPAVNIANANVVMATKHGTFFGKLEMRPEAYPDGWWEGSFTIQGLPGDQTGIARLKGYGSLEGYSTKTVVTHMSGPALQALFPDACGGSMPLGGSRAEGYVLLPGGE